MKILWHSTAPWSPSSYSVLTARTVPNMVRAGHDVTVSTWYGLQGKPLPWTVMGTNGGGNHTVNVLPSVGVDPARDQIGAGSIKPIYEWIKPDVLIPCSDIWPLNPKMTYTTNLAPWCPVDYDPVPDSIVDALKPSIYTMVYSKFGVQMLENAGVKAHYVPCSAPAKKFVPGDKKKARGQFGPKEEYDFLVTMVAANKDGSDRKGFAEAMQGFAKFHASYPDSKMYIHTNWGGPVQIYNIAKRLGIENAIMQPDQFAYVMGLLEEDYLVAVYQASDVLLNTCKSEGFGLPLVEAQMCGCPIAATDFATTDELLFAGWKIGGQLDWGIGPESWRLRVHVDAVADALEEAYHERNNKKLRKKARNGAMRFDNDTVYNQYWKPALVEIERLVNRGKRVYDFAQSLDLVPIQGFGGAADRIIPETDKAA